ncbi:VWA domain-containing protein [Nocardia uniformis]|uniref:VWA domain-containing protein n=1 Tax=Nocardia uniformis TaxID=53432 RepID=A0A849CHM3_9NOCA|nr:VWA domain-containing protein [Nocardia uniformis]NNH73171.1 VWA domain-containing protein [Nocardia uniformis]
MSSQATEGISIAVDQNEYLAEGADTVHAVITVTTTGDLVAATPPAPRVEILILDRSTSMTGERFQEARKAAMAALDELPDGVEFAIVGGTLEGFPVYPDGYRTTPANRSTRAAARDALKRLKADGGTAIGTWLAAANRLAQAHPKSIVHAILLTDGKNQGESRDQLDAQIEAATGVFSCDCRGVGSDWQEEELQAVASALFGTADIVAKPQGLSADFAAMMRTSMAKSIPDLTLRVWIPTGAEVLSIKQVAPAIEQLTDRRIESGPRTGDYPLGPWGAEDREYHLQIRVEPAAPGREKLTARVHILAEDQVLGEGLVKAKWTTDLALSARISKRVAHYTGQAELAQVIQEGLAARKDGDDAAATAKLQRAVELAKDSGHDATAKLLRAVVDVDERTGTVRLRDKVDPAEVMALGLRSTKTARVRKEQ